MSTSQQFVDFFDLVAMLADRSNRRDSAASLARAAGADEFLIFVRDHLVGHSLPAPGFPQTLRDSAGWRDLVERAAREGTATGTLTSASGKPGNAHAVGLQDGTVAVFLGYDVSAAALTAIEIVLPLLGALMRQETEAELAAVDARMARQAATQSADLAARLDSTRRELQKALGQAEKATRARDEFLATVSHELRTPLTSIIGWIQLLRLEHGTGNLGDVLVTIERNAHSQRRLIEDILDYSRINAGKLRLDVSNVDLVSVIEAAIDVMRPAADAKGIRIEAVLDRDAASLSGDASRLQQVVWNLLSNAIKFTPAGGKAQVLLSRSGGTCKLTVSDTGEGIAPDFLPYVFDRFTQADSSSSRTHSGLGLGLGIVKHLVELHGGSVQVVSEGAGKGATFTVLLPSAAPAKACEEPAPSDKPLAAARPRTPLEDLSGISVLVVEDNEDSRRLLSTILTRAGAVVRVAEDASVALEILKKGRPDVVISDIEMPREDGYSLIRKIRMQERDGQRYIPAIALTAYTRNLDRARALAAGFQMHLSKPVEPAHLVASVRTLLSGGTEGGYHDPPPEVAETF